MNPAWITNSTLRLPVVNIALMSDKIAVSDWTAAVFVSSILEEAGILPIIKIHIVDRNKIRRAGKRIRSELSK